MSNLLEQLKTLTTVVADTGDLSLIEKFRPQDVTTNPTLLTQALQDPRHQDLINRAIEKAQQEAGPHSTEQRIVSVCSDQLSVELGVHILSLIQGRVSTELDARLSYDTKACIQKAHRLIHLYEQAGISRKRILIKIAATYPGIRAAQELEKEGIHCNLTLLFSLNQAVACAEAHVTLISPFVGRILDWHKKNTGIESYPAEQDPGVVSVTQIYHYLKHFDYQTEVMGASFRNMGEILELAGCDLLTISPQFLQQLQTTEGMVSKKLDPNKAKLIPIEKIAGPLDENLFLQRHAQNQMATDKLSEGIQIFTQALIQLESIISSTIHKKSI